MVIKPQFYLADFMTGRMLGPVLPLSAVRLSSNLQPGRLSANLDMRRAAGSFAEAKQILDLMRNGKCSIVPVLEGLSNGHANPATSRALGEWWLADVDATYSDPVVKIAGPEFGGYLKDLLVTQTWAGTFSAWALVRDMLREAMRTDQTIAFSTGTGGGGPTVEVDIQKSKTDYWAGIRSAQDGEAAGFEWRVATGLGLDGIVPYSVTRALSLGAPTLHRDRPDVTLELVTPGQAPASLTDMTRSQSEHSEATTIYGFGAGSGDDQTRAYSSRSRPAGEPGKSRMISVRDAMTNGQVKRATNRALQSASSRDQVFTVRMPTHRYTPSVGEVYNFLRQPSWSMPEQFEGKVRCVGWSWAQPTGGGVDEYVLELVEV